MASRTNWQESMRLLCSWINAHGSSFPTLLHRVQGLLLRSPLLDTEEYPPPTLHHLACTLNDTIDMPDWIALLYQATLSANTAPFDLPFLLLGNLSMLDKVPGGDFISDCVCTFWETLGFLQFCKPVLFLLWQLLLEIITMFTLVLICPGRLFRISLVCWRGQVLYQICL